MATKQVDSPLIAGPDGGFLFDMRPFPKGVMIMVRSTHEKDKYRTRFYISESFDSNLDPLDAEFFKTDQDRSLLRCDDGPLVVQPEAGVPYPAHLFLEGPRNPDNPNGTAYGEIEYLVYDLGAEETKASLGDVRAGKIKSRIKVVGDLRVTPEQVMQIWDGKGWQEVGVGTFNDDKLNDDKLGKPKSRAVIQDSIVEGHFDLTHYDHVELVNSDFQVETWDELNRMLGKESVLLQGCNFTLVEFDDLDVGGDYEMVALDGARTMKVYTGNRLLLLATVAVLLMVSVISAFVYSVFY